MLTRRFVSALLLDLRDHHRANLPGPGHVGPPTGLQVDVTDGEKPDPALSGGWFDGHRLDEIGTRRELLVRHPDGANREILLNQPVQLPSDVLLVRNRLRQVEIEATTAVPDGAAGHFRGNHHGEEVHAGVHPHQSMTARPIDDRRDLGARDVLGYRLCRNMHYRLAAISLASVNDADLGPIGQDQSAPVTRLSSAHGIEYGPIELNTPLVHRSYARDTLPEVYVTLIQKFRHW